MTVWRGPTGRILEQSELRVMGRAAMTACLICLTIVPMMAYATYCQPDLWPLLLFILAGTVVCYYKTWLPARDMLRQGKEFRREQ